VQLLSKTSKKGPVAALKDLCMAKNSNSIMAPTSNSSPTKTHAASFRIFGPGLFGYVRQESARFLLIKGAKAVLIQAKTVLLVTYLGLLLAACGLPFVLLLRNKKPPAESISAALFGVCFGAIGFALLMARGVPALTSPLVLSVVFVAPLVSRGWQFMLGGLVSLPLLATTTWWNPGIELGAVQSLCFLLVGTIGAAFPHLLLQEKGAPAVLSLLILLFLGAFAVLFTGVLSTPVGFGTFWHHWSVYVGAAESFLTGAIPFRDFPVQYGFGPMLTVAALCREECWTATYVAIAVTNLLYLLAMCGCVLALTQRASRGLAIVALVAMVCAVLVWTGYPPDYMGPMATPSVNGMRFLPIALVLLYIVLAENCGLTRDSVGHMLWLFAAFWSPEAAFQATAVWWPYLTLRRAQAALIQQPLPIAIVALCGACAALAALAVTIAVQAGLFRSVFHQWPSLTGFSTYVRNPPGILPVNPTGPIWLGLAGTAAAALALVRADARGVRLGFVSLMGLLAVGSYYLGRSHDNNILNLLPFIVLALTTALGCGLHQLASGFANVALVGLIAWPLTFGFHSWTVAWQEGEAWTIGPSGFIKTIVFRTPDDWALLNSALVEMAVPHASAADAGAAMNWLRAHGDEGTPVWVSAAMLLPYGAPQDFWTGMNDLGSFGLLPPDEVERFVRHSAETLHRVGWLLVDRTQSSPWPAIFFAIYFVTEERTFGNYTLYHLAPR
jgi:hypothetical protein